ncbi:MAG: hypothetical protein U0736_07765 [Gemmataceae bacterium]
MPVTTDYGCSKTRTLFNPDVVAILVTGFANQATPLMAMRMGVRDYLDKNHDLDRSTFLTVVRRQLDRIRPLLRRERRINRGLATFRAAVDQVLPLVQTATAAARPSAAADRRPQPVRVPVAHRQRAGARWSTPSTPRPATGRDVPRPTTPPERRSMAWVPVMKPGRRGGRSGGTADGRQPAGRGRRRHGRATAVRAPDE